MDNAFITSIVTSIVAIIGTIISIISLHRTSKTENLKNDLEKLKIDLEKEKVDLEKKKFGTEFLEAQYEKIKKIQLELSKVQQENTLHIDGSNATSIALAYFSQSVKIYREHYNLLSEDIGNELFQIQKEVNTLLTKKSETEQPYNLQIEYFMKLKGFIDQKLKTLGKRIEMMRSSED